MLLNHADNHKFTGPDTPRKINLDSDRNTAGSQLDNMLSSYLIEQDKSKPQRDSRLTKGSKNSHDISDIDSISDEKINTPMSSHVQYTDHTLPSVKSNPRSYKFDAFQNESQLS